MGQGIHVEFWRRKKRKRDLDTEKGNERIYLDET
jgi:hypothetical protein